MPAGADEIKEAEAEGIRVMYLVAPEGLDIKDGKLTGVTLKNQVLGSTDASGRRSPESVNCESFYIPCDTLVLAIGQQTEEIKGIKYNNGSLAVDLLTMKTDMPHVYAGGDAVSVKSVIAAIAAGRRAAMSMAAELSGEAFIPEPPELPTVETEAVLMRSGYIPRTGRVSTIFRDGAERAKDFDTYTRVLTESEAVAEALRCLNCGCGEGCQTCKTICCDFAVSLDGADRVKIDKTGCVACGMCYNLCPNKNIEMVSTGEKV